MDSVKGKKKHTSYMEVEKLSLCIEEKREVAGWDFLLSSILQRFQWKFKFKFFFLSFLFFLFYLESSTKLVKVLF